MTGRLAVAGCSGTHPAHGRACSSFLVDDGSTRVVLDLGNGALANLTDLTDVAHVDAVLISHHHPDHFADVVGLSYALRFDPRGPSTVDLVGPRETAEVVTRHLDASSSATLLRTLHVSEVGPGDAVVRGGISVELVPSAHPARAMSMRVEAGGRVVAYSGDSGGGGDLVDCARGADLLVCEATWLHADGPYPDGMHLTGRGAGQVAADAGVAHLALTHVSPHASRAAVAAEAARVYDGPITLLDDRMEIIW